MAQVSSYIYREGVSANTRLLNTQKVKVYSFDAEGTGMTQIGVIQTWNPTHTKAIEPVRGIGFGDQIAELAVGVTDLNASCTIMMMYLRDIMQVFGYKGGTSGSLRSLKHHRWPFDVKEAIVIPAWIRPEVNASNKTAILTWYEGCWLTDYSKSFNMGDTSTAQDCSMMITDVYDTPETDYTTYDGGNSQKSALYSKAGQA